MRLAFFTVRKFPDNDKVFNRKVYSKTNAPIPVSKEANGPLTDGIGLLEIYWQRGKLLMSDFVN